MPLPPLLEHKTLDAGDTMLLRAYSGIRFTLWTESGATLTYSKVNDHDASAHEGAETIIAADTETAVDVEWPYYYIVCAGGTGHVALI